MLCGADLLTIEGQQDISFFQAALLGRGASLLRSLHRRHGYHQYTVGKQLDAHGLAHGDQLPSLIGPRPLPSQRQGQHHRQQYGSAPPHASPCLRFMHRITSYFCFRRRRHHYFAPQPPVSSALNSARHGNRPARLSRRRFCAAGKIFRSEAQLLGHLPRFSPLQPRPLLCYSRGERT